MVNVFAPPTPLELPPHARRIRLSLLSFLHSLGTTSACAENTKPGSVPMVKSMELPPHARRIRQEYVRSFSSHGTTSACAENTTRLKQFAGCYGNYLRMRGEYCATIPLEDQAMELPPHARRIHLHDA